MKAKGLIALLFALSCTTGLAAQTKKNDYILQDNKDLYTIIEEANFIENFFRENKFLFPLDTSKHYSISSECGERKNPLRKRIGGAYKKEHYGWDISCRFADLIVPTDAVIKRTGYSKTKGFFIDFETEIKYPYISKNGKTRYVPVKFSFFHLNPIPIKERKALLEREFKKGDKITYNHWNKKEKKHEIRNVKTGDSGITTGPHLHQEFFITLLEEGKLVNRYFDPAYIYPWYQYFEK